MKLQLIAVGGKMPAWVTQGYEDYARRLPRDMLPQLIEIPVGHRAKNAAPSDAIAAEGSAILRALSPQTRLVALDVQGSPWSTETLAEELARWRMEGRDTALVIGGPDGLSAECLKRADQRWSLSRLTLPHPLVRVVLIEQLYRAWTLLNHHPYHK